MKQKLSMIKISLWLLVIFVVTVFSLYGNRDDNELSGKIIKITDGDTVTLLTENKETFKVRLSEIDTPEKEQPWGNQSKLALSQLIFNENVIVKTLGNDRYNRVIGRIYRQHDKLDVNAYMVETGNAWAYRKYLKDESLIELEDVARINKRGLWSLPEFSRVEPWVWRKEQRERRKNKVISGLNQSGSLFTISSINRVVI